MKRSRLEEQKKRRNIQTHFYSIVGSAEHINLPKLEDAIKKEFHTQDHRLIQTQVNLMQTEARIHMESKAKVWVMQPEGEKEAYL